MDDLAPFSTYKSSIESFLAPPHGPWSAVQTGETDLLDMKWGRLSRQLRISIFEYENGTLQLVISKSL
uniref:Uncharacterized protein n=1 Tax=Trichuris muris TaxID=70415 RepID=A0A5S6QXC0_TRIMR